MATVLAIASGVWIRLPDTEWEVYQESGEAVFLGDGDVAVRIRRVNKLQSRAEQILAAGRGNACTGMHCTCMNLGGGCPHLHHGDHICPHERVAT